MKIIRANAAAKLPAEPDVSPVDCNLDALDGLSIEGWAFDPRIPNAIACLHIIVDDQQLGTVMCDKPRPDVEAAGRGHRNVGFRFTLPIELADGLPHRLMIRDLRRNVVMLTFAGQRQESAEVTIASKPAVSSHVDGLKRGSFEGWVMRTDLGQEKPVGNCMVRVTCDGITIGHVRAGRNRGDVGRSLNGPANCGFRFQIPRMIRSSRQRKFQFFLMPEDIELHGSPCSTSVVQDDGEGRLLDLVHSVDAAHRELTRLRRQLRELVPRPHYSIADYDIWFDRYLPALQARVKAAAPEDGWRDGPLVSVICPVYRPRIEDFKAAIASVLDQSYPNLELVLVDDNSRQPELTAYLQELVVSDKRVVLVTHKRNQGISAATNSAIAKASGEWIAFFDHDDLLVDVAIECMLTAATRTNALVLYSDEDKISDDGSLSAPAFKTKWNHRLLLGVNYVCHLLFVQRAALQEVGALDKAMDGAQDHDLILRLSEHVDADRIQHVPEVLYHWRITPNSTAQSSANKQYATDAGQKAITQHLVRLGRTGEVESMSGATFYRINWTLAREPAVTIIIPYKDQIATTQRCVDAILSLTRYDNYKIVLIDNWSTSREAVAFSKKIKKNDRIKLVRIEEDFNYSRLNNSAARDFPAEYYVFMNNDLFVKDENWLRTLVSEAEVDSTVGAVGGKLLYPDGSLQHGGVVVGLGGVAGHAHTGLQADDPGYAARLWFAQEMSAVTAAAILVRASAFEEVGGFDEVGLQVAFNDVDLCLKLRSFGYKVIWTPEFVADHHESLSRGDDERPLQEGRFFEETELMKERWGDTLLSDPFYHPRFSLDGEAFFDLGDPDAAAG